MILNGTRHPAMPYAARWGVYSTPGSLILKTTAGWELESIPTYLDVRAGAAIASGALDRGGALDRVLNHFTRTVKVSRVHPSARSGAVIGRGSSGFDETEHALGLSRTFQVDVDDQSDIAAVVDALRHLGVVEHAYPHYMAAVPFDAVTAIAAWVGRELVRAIEATSYEPGDPAVIVGVIDTGAALEHPELAGSLRRGADTVQLIPGDLPAGVTLLADVGGVPEEPDDGVGHGTACAGIIAAAGHDMPPGLAGRCAILPIRVLGSALFPGKKVPTGIGAIADIDCGVKRAVDLGAKVLNMSFGTPEASLGPDDPAPHQDVIRYALARGCILVAASGNSGAAEAYSPACLPGVIAVSACDDAGQPAAFSTSGKHVDLAAPGVDVLSAGLTGYARVTGTSFAAPFVAAAAALLAARAANRAHPIDGYDAHRILTATARPWPAGVPPDAHGIGVLDAHAALQALDREIDAANASDRREAGAQVKPT